MADVNWDLLKFKYEVLEYTVEDLAAENNLPLSVIEYAAQKWEQVPLAERAKEFDVETDIQSDVTEQARIFKLIKQKYLAPKYIELETTLLHKAIEAAGSLDPLNIKGIKELTDTLKNLLVEQRDEESGGGGQAHSWDVNIIESKDEKPTAKRTEKISPIRNHQKAL